MHRRKVDRDFWMFLGSILPGVLIAALILAIEFRSYGVWPSLPASAYMLAEGDHTANVASIEQLPQAQWKSVDPERGYFVGFMPRETWFRFDLPVDAFAVSYIVKLIHSHVREADIYLKAGNSSPLEKLGSANEPNGWVWPIDPTVRVVVPPQAARTIYVRTAPRAIWATFVNVHKEVDYLAQKQQERLVGSLVKGATLGTLLACIVFYIILRQSIFAYIILFQLSMISWLLSREGYAMWLFPSLGESPTQHRIVSDAILLLATYFGNLAVTHHLQGAEYFLTRLSTRLLAIVTLTGAAALPFVSSDLADVVLGLVFAWILVIFILQMPRQWKRGNAVFLGFLASGLAPGIFAAVFCYAGVLRESIYFKYSAEIGTTWTSTILLVDIARRMRALQLERQRTLDLLQETSKTQMERSREPASFEVSAMFIDMVGFSKAAEVMGSDRIFESLSQQMLAMTAIIEQHHGVVDRSLGDGLLCYFPAAVTHHALRAWEVANKIQLMVIEATRASQRGRSKMQVFPVRIGIHSDHVLLGNLGGESRIDFTMVGQGVMLANRLEQACAPYRIMVSAATRAELVAQGVDSVEFQEIYIPIKNRPDLILAYESDPFADQIAKLAAEGNQSRNVAGAPHRETRYLVTGEPAMSLKSAYGTFQVLEFSLQGFKASSANLIAHGAVVEVTLTTGDQDLDRELADRLLSRVTIEVRWSRGRSGSFVHGFAVVGEAPAPLRARYSVLLRHPGVQLIEGAVA